MDPPMTASPSVISIGIGSPVTSDSSIAERPPITRPSTGTRSPGRMPDEVADCDCFDSDFDLTVTAHDPCHVGLQVE